MDIANDKENTSLFITTKRDSLLMSPFKVYYGYDGYILMTGLITTNKRIALIDMVGIHIQR